MCFIYYIHFFWVLFSLASGRGVLLLYQPLDISKDCAFSQRLRYDITYGMGMSDTKTLLFRTMKEVDYECEVDIVTEKRFDLYLLIVIRFPNNILTNCHLNPDAFTLYNQDQCLRLCDHLYADSPRSMSTYFTASLKGKMRFRFVSNCSINSEMNANLYEVTATSARIKGNKHCNLSNESLCIMGNIHYCFTSGVACDGLMSVGLNAGWLRKSSVTHPFSQYVALLHACCSQLRTSLGSVFHHQQIPFSSLTQTKTIDCAWTPF
ncbi:uncharacterized protein LOC113227931 isoform X2 [Hyposmocoma kahamanoa]|uniref:uncharacterized protein LOC113227931 isoform X2 n=1 Tax=Hyposmocoma kahamanoa TaxID=1477025 RepID=UPI000E6D5FC2|nr:uncharacterized protein LOC113227931 isoform X2 [Hyposmocoma kahamanoa]